ncbi:MAG: hypothetical protein ACK55I_48715 [bacterium]
MVPLHDGERIGHRLGGGRAGGEGQEGGKRHEAEGRQGTGRGSGTGGLGQGAAPAAVSGGGVRPQFRQQG